MVASAPADRQARAAALIGRVALADQRAFEELYRLTSSHLYAVALRIVRDRGVAEELLQEAYVAVWHHAASYSADRAQPSTWLTAIVRNRCLDHVRKRELDTVSMTRDEGEGAPELDLPDGGPGPAELLAAGAQVRVHDPVAEQNVRAIYGDRIEYFPHHYDTLEGADALCVVTEWQEFRNPDFEYIRHKLARPLIFDGRNLWDPQQMAARGFTYYGIGLKG